MRITQKEVANTQNKNTSTNLPQTIQTNLETAPTTPRSTTNTNNKSPPKTPLPIIEKIIVLNQEEMVTLGQNKARVINHPSTIKE